uniref:hypothetical protein n=1 Tax=Pseudactinotalea sp. TaxID=1926260 RepID=UPI003B3A6327
MSGHEMDLLLLGDNQFFGVNHMSEARARAQSMQFQDTSAIIEVIDTALDHGIRTFMCTTHERVGEVCDHMRRDPERYAGYRFYPCMPYAHKYANAVTEHGMLGAVRQSLPNSSLLGAALKGGRSLASKDVEGVMTMLIDAEMAMFDGLSTPVVFLQNVVTDLMLGLGFDEAFAVFAQHVKDRYDAEPGFITMNLPMLLDALERVGVENPIVCANINKIGFRMSGGVEAYAQALQSRVFRPVEMSVFASGALQPREALRWLHDQGQVDSIVFGASSERSIRSTTGIAAELWST